MRVVAELELTASGVVVDVAVVRRTSARAKRMKSWARTRLVTSQFDRRLALTRRRLGETRVVAEVRSLDVFHVQARLRRGTVVPVM